MRKGYNPERICKPSQRATKAKVLTVLNRVGRFTRVPSSQMEFMKKELGVVEVREINEHRTEFFNADGRCVMIYEF